MFVVTRPSCTLIHVPSPATAFVSQSLEFIPTAGEIIARYQLVSSFHRCLRPPAVRASAAWRNVSGYSLDTSSRPFAAPCAPRHTPYIVQLQDQTMVRVTGEELDDGMFIDADGNVVDPAITPIVLMPDPKLRRTVGPWQLWIVTTDEAGSLPSEVEMGSFYEAEEACDAGGPAAEFSS